MSEPPHSSTLPGGADAPSNSPASGEPHRAGESPPDPPPPSRARLRTMAAVRWVILLAVTALAAHTLWTLWGPPSHDDATAAGEDFYCPMHPQIRSRTPGECPICQMRLEPIPRERHGAIGAAGPSTPGDRGMAMARGDAGAETTGDGGGALEGLVPVNVPPARQQAVGVTTAPVVRRTIAASLRVPGAVEAPENARAEVHVRAAGFVERVAVRETGVRVSRGQTLAWIYSPQIYQAEQELLTAHRWAATRPPTSAADVALHPTMPGHDPPTPASQSGDVESAARRNLELLGLAPADLDAIVRAGTPLRAVPVRAPAAGYVTRYAALLGMYATPEATLYELADLSRVWIVASVYAGDVARIHPGADAVFVQSGAAGAAPVRARVELVEPDVSVATRTARVRLAVANPGLALRPGTYGDVTFDLPPATALVVPRDAVIDTGTQQYAFVATGDDRFEPRRVRAGALVDDAREVLEGLREGERVVVRGGFLIDSESRLEASLAAAPSPSTAPDEAHGGAASDATGPDCDAAFDRARYPDRYTQCRACEQMHRGMGRMEADCKNAIPRPWR